MKNNMNDGLHCNVIILIDVSLVGMHQKCQPGT